jgi:hypothetical protein
MSVFTARRLRAGLALGLTVVVAGAGSTTASAAPAASDVQRTLVERAADGPAAPVKSKRSSGKLAKRHAKAVKRAKKHPSQARAVITSSNHNLGCAYNAVAAICGNYYPDYYPGWVYVNWVSNGVPGEGWYTVDDWNYVWDILSIF